MHSDFGFMMMRRDSDDCSSSGSNASVRSSPQHQQSQSHHPIEREATKKTSDNVLSVSFAAGTDIPFQPAAPSLKPKSSTTSVVTQDLMKMTLQEREQINEEIHGVKSLAVAETPELISRSLSNLEEEINRQLQQHTPESMAYMEAQQLGNAYIHQPSLRLKFLRASLFNVHLAAQRLLGFLRLTRDVLGIEALAKIPVSLDHFAFDEHGLLREGAFQILPGRDRVGRRITGIFEDFGAGRPLSAKLRVAVYILMAATEDEDTQKKGSVCVFFHSNPSTQLFSTPEERVVFQRLFDTFPLRVSAAHVCLPNDDTDKFQTLKQNLTDSLGSETRKRMRIHTGSPTKIHCELETFGISAEMIPINSNTGKLKTNHFSKWINMRLAREEHLARAVHAAAAVGRLDGAPPQPYRFPWIECPTLQDVLLGRGRPIMNHNGNVTMRELVGSKLRRFNAATQKRARNMIIEEVILEIQAAGGRFLREDPNMNGFWIEVDMKAARQKVGIYFRDLRSSTPSTAVAAPAGGYHLNSSTSTVSSTSGSSSRGRSPASIQESTSSAAPPPSRTSVTTTTTTSEDRKPSPSLSGNKRSYNPDE